MLARRRTLPSMLEPPYALEEVPRCKKDLEGSVVLQMPADRATREEWLRMMPELVMLCNEAAARAAQRLPAPSPSKAADADCSKHHKPIDLEYLADRLDTDDPMTGYVVRSSAEGWIQGFITQTVFTTWQRYFTWDSLAHEAGVLEDAEDEPDSKCDVTGILGRELAAQVHAGDPDGGGVIWPHIAEISLLAGIGCGGWLLKTMLEELEQPGSPYEFVVLQASENSINFYEHHGFTRVGALARYEDEECLKRAAEADGSAAAPETGHMSSPTVEVKARDNETPSQLANRVGKNVKVSDIMFLNKDLYPGLTASSKLQRGTKLRVPVVRPPPQERTDGLPPVYLAKNDETPRQIANKLKIDVKALVNLNKRFLTGLNQHSRLRPNSKLRIPSQDGVPPDQDDWTLFGDVVGYRHWTFPDEHESAISNTGVSYMMARKLTPKKGKTKANLEPEKGSMLECLQKRLVHHAPQLKVTRSGIGIAVPGAAPVDEAPASELVDDQDNKVQEPHGVKREREDDSTPSTVPPAAPEPPVWVPPTGPMVIDAGNYKALKAAVMTIRKQTCAEPFLEPVPEEVEGYYERIKQPMDLEKIKKKLEDSNKCRYSGRQGYVTLPEVEADVDLILSNCREFNTGTPHGEYFLNMADMLGAFVRKTFAQLESDWRAGKYVKSPPAAAAAVAPARDGPDAKRQKRMPKKYLEAIWEALANAHTDDGARPIAGLFLDLPPKSDYPDYYRAIARPVSLNCMKRKIDGSKYDDFDKFKRDVDRLVENARTYNVEGSIVVQDAETLGEIFKTKAAAVNAKWKKDEMAAGRAAEVVLVEDPAEKERREAMAKLEKRKPEKPKRATTGFFAFVSERRNGMREAHPELSNTDVAKLLGVEWKALTEEVKAKYEAVAAEDRIRAAAAKESWTVAMEAWEKERQELIIRLGTAEEKQAALMEQHKARKPVPVRTNTPYLCYSIKMREAISKANTEKSTTQVTQEIAKSWNAMDDEGKAPFVDMAAQEKEAAAPAIAKYERDLAAWKKEMDALTPRLVRDVKKPSYLEDDGLELDEMTQSKVARRPQKAAPVLFNKVVRVDGLGERYYYVLTYIPDLFWCRVAPMRQAGTFSADREKAAKGVTGRPRWMLEPEGEGGGELDVSALRCVQLKARAVRRVQDADKEEWDIADQKKPKLPKLLPQSPKSPKSPKPSKPSEPQRTSSAESSAEDWGIGQPATQQEPDTDDSETGSPVVDVMQGAVEMQNDDASGGSGSAQHTAQKTTAVKTDAPTLAVDNLAKGAAEADTTPLEKAEDDPELAKPGEWVRTGHPFLGCRVKDRSAESDGVVDGTITQYRAAHTSDSDLVPATWKVVNDDGTIDDRSLSQVKEQLRAAGEWKKEWASLHRHASSPPDSCEPDSPTDEESEEEKAIASAAPQMSDVAAAVGLDTVNENAEPSVASGDEGDTAGDGMEGVRKRKSPTRFMDSKFRGSCDSRRKDGTFDVTSQRPAKEQRLVSDFFKPASGL